MQLEVDQIGSQGREDLVLEGSHPPALEGGQPDLEAIVMRVDPVAEVAFEDLAHQTFSGLGRRIRNATSFAS
jgi:hypothetical protein